mmetsp:Transcript_30942/g.50051  ORF Transcript_30942/g.50051 Transcript_30942/m.50051 type:complete len:209 (+) Transcript_30942:142-768(+)|eukprot:CAMPEP_0184668632 /NCGR_PEP_ID=MMETSP0308-20130426/73217_1 /TAXON_ID=38269 /ORGANISM="Gloeochaete witrockiana, Strain SAG 46.84" /LENGTH=208 /DNA_ID=CAMNT_0027114449 /DNA_START=144 /DNA_END=770 /DNA_ORIENTATION=-
MSRASANGKKRVSFQADEQVSSLKNQLAKREQDIREKEHEYRMYAEHMLEVDHQLQAIDERIEIQRSEADVLMREKRHTEEQLVRTRQEKTRVLDEQVSCSQVIKSNLNRLVWGVLLISWAIFAWGLLTFKTECSTCPYTLPPIFERLKAGLWRSRMFACVGVIPTYALMYCNRALLNDHFPSNAVLGVLTLDMYCFLMGFVRRALVA